MFGLVSKSKYLYALYQHCETIKENEALKAEVDRISNKLEVQRIASVGEKLCNPEPIAPYTEEEETLRNKASQFMAKFKWIAVIERVNVGTVNEHTVVHLCHTDIKDNKQIFFCSRAYHKTFVERYYDWQLTSLGKE